MRVQLTRGFVLERLKTLILKIESFFIVVLVIKSSVLHLSQILSASYYNVPQFSKIKIIFRFSQLTIHHRRDSNTGPIISQEMFEPKYQRTAVKQGTKNRDCITW